MKREDGSDAGDRTSPRLPLRPGSIVSALVEAGIEFIVVGGFAVAAHGFPRATKDVDICPNPEEANLFRLATVLEELEVEPIGLDEFEGEFDLKPDLEGLKAGGNWTLITKFGRLDLMQHLEGLGDGGGGWNELRPHAIPRRFLDHDCLFCSFEDLIRMKLASGRPQDEVDIQSLKAARSEL